MRGKVAIKWLAVFAVFLLVLAVSQVVVAQASADKTLLCHKTGSEQNPYVVQSVAANEVQSHEANGDFVYGGVVGKNGHPSDKDWCQNHQPESTPTPGPTPCFLVIKYGEGQTGQIPCPSATPTSGPLTSSTSDTGGWKAPTCSDALPPAPSQVTVTNFDPTGSMDVHWIPTVNPSTPFALIKYQIPDGPTYYSQPVANTGVATVHFQSGLSDVFTVSVAQDTGCAVSLYSATVLVQSPAKQTQVEKLGSK